MSWNTHWDNKHRCPKYVFLILALFSCLVVSSQFTSINLDRLIAAQVAKREITGRIPEDIKIFYNLNGYKFSWLAINDRNRKALFDLLSEAEKYALRATDYRLDWADSIQYRLPKLKNFDDSLLLDLNITARALSFFSDLDFGIQKPAFGYEGLDNPPACHDIPVLLVDAMAKKDLHQLARKLNSTLPEILPLLNRLDLLLQRAADTAVKETVIVSSKATPTNLPLVRKLYGLGIWDSLPKQLTEKQVKAAVKMAQQQFTLMADGVLRSTILEQLNVPLASRVEQLKLAINYYRWLHRLAMNEAVIVVNIPSAYMKVYRKDLVILEMRMVLGKPMTPTPTLTSRINEVILYPYWHVPRSIATKELLPMFRQNPGLVNSGSFQILDSRARIIDPYKVNWKELNAKNFPYLVRQSTGCDNALGLLKLDFYSPFGVYLHDTPHKSAFLLNKRFFSHGCLRMENPVGLGHLVLRNNALAIDTIEQKGCLLNQAPIIVHADEKMPVVVWYNPVGTDSTGRVLFFEDVYKKFPALTKRK